MTPQPHYHAGWIPLPPGAAPATWRTLATAQEAMDYILDYLAGALCRCHPAAQCGPCQTVAQLCDTPDYHNGCAVLDTECRVVYCLHPCTGAHA